MGLRLSGGSVAKGGADRVAQKECADSTVSLGFVIIVLGLIGLLPG